MINCKEATDLIIVSFGKQRLAGDLDPDDFAKMRDGMAKRWGAVRVRDMVQRVRSVFKYGLDVGLLDRPAGFGPGFARPSKKAVRLVRAKQGPKLFTAGECRSLIGAAGVPLKAMLLLGVNCGLGNSDCANLPLATLDLKGGWLDFPRPKTGIKRRCPLWPETVAALREVLARRKEPKDAADAGLLFITKYGDRWGKDTMDNPVTKETKKLMDKVGITGRRGLGFYTLRHVFRTVADEAKDQVATDYIMGHEVRNMSAAYRETISDARLRAVADHVNAWLFPPAPKGKQKAKGKGRDEEE
jgi:integrase